jgi:HlyD family secretion protein
VPSDVTIRSGYSANAEIVLDRADNVVTLPESAIQFDGEDTYVMVKQAEDYVRRDVVTGISDGIDIEVKEGVADGEKVRGAQIIIKKK